MRAKKKDKVYINEHIELYQPFYSFVMYAVYMVCRYAYEIPDKPDTKTMYGHAGQNKHKQF